MLNRDDVASPQLSRNTMSPSVRSIKKRAQPAAGGAVLGDLAASDRAGWATHKPLRLNVATVGVLFGGSEATSASLLLLIGRNALALAL